MHTIQERNFHLLMGGLFLSSLVLDPAMRSIMPEWKPPAVGFVTLAVGLVWIGRYTWWRTGAHDREVKRLRERLDALEDRLERVEETQRADRARRL